MNTHIAPTSLSLAHEILGERIIAPLEVESLLNARYSSPERDSLKLVPFSSSSLEKRRSTHLLIAGYSVTIVDLAEKFGGILHSTWFTEEPFATSVRVEPQWYLLSTEWCACPKSFGKKLQDQLALLSQEECILHACEYVYIGILAFLARQIKLFENYDVRSVDFSSCHDRVNVRMLSDEKELAFGFSLNADDDCYGDMGICPAIKPLDHQ